MAPPLPRLLYLVHDSPGRLRLRLSSLHDAPDEAQPIAEALSALDGVAEVRVRAYTGSVLVLYDPARIPVERIRAEAVRVTGVDHVLAPGEETPAEVRALLERSLSEGSELAREAARAFKGLDVDVLRATGGTVSLGSLISLGLLGAAIERIVTSGSIELPDWHQLAWWSFRSFTTLEDDALDAADRRIAEELHRAH